MDVRIAHVCDFAAFFVTKRSATILRRTRAGSVEEPAREFLGHFYDLINLNDVLPVVAEIVDVEATLIIRGKVLSKFDGTSNGRIRLVIVEFRIL